MQPGRKEELIQPPKKQITSGPRVLTPQKRNFIAYELLFDPPQIHRYINHQPDQTDGPKEGSGKYVLGYKNNNHQELELFALLTCPSAIDFEKLEKMGTLPPDKQPPVEEQLKILSLMGEIQADFEHNEILAKYRREILPDAKEFRFIGGGLISIDLGEKLIQITRGSASTGFVPWSILADSFKDAPTYAEFVVKIILGDDERDIGRAINRREESWYREIGAPVILPKRKFKRENPSQETR